MQNRIFFPQEALDLWLADGHVELSGSELLLSEEGRRYRLAEAAHVLREVTGSADGHEIVGRVKSKQYLDELGAELLEGSMLLGDNAYDVVPGFLATPMGTFEEFLASPERKKVPLSSGPAPKNDEDLLTRFGRAHL